MPPDPLRKNQLFSGRTHGHQFFFTTGWKERFAQLLRPARCFKRQRGYPSGFCQFWTFLTDFGQFWTFFRNATRPHNVSTMIILRGWRRWSKIDRVAEVVEVYTGSEKITSSSTPRQISKTACLRYETDGKLYEKYW